MAYKEELRTCDKAICSKCLFHTYMNGRGSDLACYYYIMTGNRRDCAAGNCNKFRTWNREEYEAWRREEKEKMVQEQGKKYKNYNALYDFENFEDFHMKRRSWTIKRKRYERK